MVILKYKGLVFIFNSLPYSALSGGRKRVFFRLKVDMIDLKTEELHNIGNVMELQLDLNDPENIETFKLKGAEIVSNYLKQIVSS